MPRRSTTKKRTLGQNSSPPAKSMKLYNGDGSESNCSSPEVPEDPQVSSIHSESMLSSHSTSSSSSEMIQQPELLNQQQQQESSSPPKPISVAAHIPSVIVVSTSPPSSSIAHQVDQFVSSEVPNTISSTKRRFNKAKSEFNNNNTNTNTPQPTSTPLPLPPLNNQSPSSPETLTTTTTSANIKAPPPHTVLTENTSKIVETAASCSTDPSPIMIASSSTTNTTINGGNNNNNNATTTADDRNTVNSTTTINTDTVQDFDFIITDPDVEMQFKKSRDYNFNPSFPKVLYTLTWKHKYDLKISSQKPIFQGVPQKFMTSQIKIELVMGRDFSTPSYDHSKVRQRDRAYSDESRKKRPHRKPNELETTTLTSVSKDNDYSIIVRFGINRTFCSKRFNYAPFRLRLDFESDQHPFTLFSPIFHSFAKKLTSFTVVNVNEILKKNGDALLPVDDTDEVYTDLIGVYRPSITSSIPSSEGGYSGVASSSSSGVVAASTAPSKGQQEASTEDDANLLLSLGGF